MSTILPEDLATILILNIYCNIEINESNFNTIYKNIYTSSTYLKTWFLDIDKELLNKTIRKQIDDCLENLLKYDIKNHTVRVRL